MTKRERAQRGADHIDLRAIKSSGQETIGVKVRMRLFVSVCFSMVFCIGSAWALSAQDGTGEPGTPSYTQTVRNPTVSIPNFDVASVSPIITEMGYNWTTKTTQSGKQFLVVDIRNIKIILLPSACREGGNSACVGLQSVAYFNGQRLSPGLVWRFNNDNPFAYIGLEGDEGFYIRRYDIADFGTPRGNVEASIQNFRVFIDNVSRAFGSSGAGANLEVDDPQSPTALVQQRLNEAEFLSGNRRLADPNHAYLEYVDDTLFDLIADPALPRNIVQEIPAPEAE